MTTLQCAIIGAGRIAQAYAQAIAESEEVTLLGVVDTDPEAGASMARVHDCEPYRSVQALLNGGAVPDLAVICTPPNAHRDLAIRCVEAGMHVLCEKPFSLTEEESREMCAAASEADRLLTMGSKFRYVPDVVEARKLIRDGRIGEVVLFENVFASRVPMADRWNSDPRISGGGVLIDNGTHSLDIVRYLFGSLTEIQALEGRRVQNLPVEDTVRVNIHTVDRIIGSIDLSWSVNKAQDAYLTVFGTEGTLVVGWRESRYCLRNDKEWTVFGEGYDKKTAFRRQIDNVARAIRGEEELVITCEDAIASVIAVERAYRSMSSFKWTTIPGVPLGFRSGRKEAEVAEVG